MSTVFGVKTTLAAVFSYTLTQLCGKAFHLLETTPGYICVCAPLRRLLSDSLAFFVVCLKN